MLSALRHLTQAYPMTSVDARLSRIEERREVLVVFDVLHAGERRVVRRAIPESEWRGHGGLREHIGAGLAEAAETVGYLDELRQGMRDLVDQ